MQWRRQRKITHVIGSSNHVLLLARYQDAPPGEKDEEEGKRNGYTRGHENGTSSINGQTGQKSGRTDSAGSATSDYASDYASVVSRSRRYDNVGPPSQPKVIFNENEYTRITTPRQDVLFKKGYLSRKKVSASTASTSATPSTTESQSASHSTADGSETTEDQQLLDCKENGAEEYAAMLEPGAQVAYGTFYDHASGYYYEYPVMVVGPGAGMPGPAMHDVLTAVPCGPVPLRPIQWINPAFVPKMGNQQYCVMDYQAAHLAQYPTMIDENHVPLVAPVEQTNGTEETYRENGTESVASWADVVDEEDSGVTTIENDTQNGTPEISSASAVEDEIVEAPINSDDYLETSLSQQLQVTHVAVPPLHQPYMYPGHYMFGPSLVNVNGVTVQCGPMVRNTGVIEGMTNAAWAKRRKRRKLNKRKGRRSCGPDNAEDEEQAEEDCSSEAENVAGFPSKPGCSDASSPRPTLADVDNAVAVAMTIADCQLNPECQEFRPIVESRIAPTSVDVTIDEIAIHRPNHDPPSIADSFANDRSDANGETVEKSIGQITPIPTVIDDSDATISKISETIVVTTSVEIADKKNVPRSNDDVEIAPIEFAIEVFANSTNMAERAIEPRNVVDGTPMETEIGVDATSVNFKDIVDDSKASRPIEEISKNRRTNDSAEDRISTVEKNISNDKRTLEKFIATDSIAEISSNATETIDAGKRDRGSVANDRRGSRSSSPGMINRTTTPINAMTQRLPESYESLITRAAAPSSSSTSSSSSTTSSAVTQPQSARNRKYSAKTSKFVREATPGPDLDTINQQQSSRSNPELDDSTSSRKAKIDNVNNSEPIVITAETSSRENANSNDEFVTTGIDAIEAEIQRFSVSTNGSLYDNVDVARKTDVNADCSNDDSGVEIQTKFTSDRPITNAVAEWLRRANSPDIFVTTKSGFESEPEDDELDDREPSKNLKGNPMPALSANTIVKDVKSSRLSGNGEFATIVDVEATTKSCRATKSNNDKTTTRNGKNFETTRRKKRTEIKRRGSRKFLSKIVNDGSSFDDENIAKKITSSSIVVDAKLSTCDNPRIVKNEVCEFTEKDSAVGVRVAKSSRRKNMMMMMTTTTTTTTDSCEDVKRSNGDSSLIGLSGRDVGPVENVDVKVRRLLNENDEGIVEDEEVSVRTFEKGQIVVSCDGKLLPIATYQPIVRQSRTNDDDATTIVHYNDGELESSKTTDDKIPCNDDESVITENSSIEKNSLGSIVEPDVLECWEAETVEPFATLANKRIAGNEIVNDVVETDNDRVAVEIVRKYYRLEAVRDSVASVDSMENYNDVDVDRDREIEKISLPDDCRRTIDGSRSEDIPVIGERMTEIVEKMFANSGLPIDEAVEVYESCYNVKTPSYLLDFDKKSRINGSLRRLDSERIDNLPCKAACCNIQ